jgi:hypothetical protein
MNLIARPDRISKNKAVESPALTFCQVNQKFQSEIRLKKGGAKCIQIIHPGLPTCNTIEPSSRKVNENVCIDLPILRKTVTNAYSKGCLIG